MAHRLDGHEFEQTPGDSEGQGILACCRPWGTQYIREKSESPRNPARSLGPALALSLPL